MPNPETLLDSLERFAAALTGGYGIGDVLHNLTEEMAEVLDVTGAGVTLVHDGQLRFVTAAVEAIATLERVQENWQKSPRNWSAEDLRVATVFASIATGYLINASAAQKQQRTAEQLQQAMNTRLIIEQAKGVLANRREITVDDAFQTLRKYARDHDARIHDVCRAVVTGDLLL